MKGITCDGLPTGRTDLIKDGRLVGLLSRWYDTQRLLDDPEPRRKIGADRAAAAASSRATDFRFIRINDNITRVLRHILGITRDVKGTVAWSADEVVYAPEIAVGGVHVDEIAGQFDTSL